jgi:hypothetical protein
MYGSVHLKEHLAMKFKDVLLIAALAVSLTLAVVLFARSSQPTVAGGVPGDYVQPPRSGPVLTGGLSGGVVNDRALTGNDSQSIPMTRSGGADQGE